MQKLFLIFENNCFRTLLLITSLLIGASLYIPGLPGGFSHDDFPNIIHNTALHIDNLEPDTLLAASFSSESGTLRRPVSMLSFAINYYYTQLNPKYFKIVNIIIHALTSLGIFLLSRCLLRSYIALNKKKVTSSQIFYLSLFVSFAWLVSPINLTGVLYIIQRMTSLSALFSIFGLYLYMLGRHSMIFNFKLNIPAFAASALFFVISIFCKENGVLNLLYLICIEIFILHFLSAASISKKYYMILFLIVVVLPIAFLIAWAWHDPSYITKGYEHRPFTMIERLLTQLRALTFYIKQIFIPNNTALGLFHDDFAISKSILHPITTLASAIFLLLLVLASIFKRKKYALFAFGLFFYLCSHLLESTIIALEMIYEHRNYIGSFGIIFAVATTIYFSIKDPANRRFAIVVGCSWLIAISYTTTSRANQWESSLSLALYEVEHHPKSSRAHYYLGRTYANLSQMEFFDKKEEALLRLESAMKLSETGITAETVAIRLAGKMNIPPKQWWLESIDNKIKSNPIDHIIVGGFKELNKCLNSTCSIDAKQVFMFYQTALNNRLPYPDTYKSSILTLYAEFSAKHIGDYLVAYNASKDAVLLSPEILRYRINFIYILNILGKFDEAKEQIEYIRENDVYKLYTKLLIELDIKK